MVFDFDTTLAAVDPCCHALERLGSGDWREIERAYRRGAIGARQRIGRLWDAVPAAERALEEMAAELPLDPAAAPLVAALRAAGAEVTVISDSWGVGAARWSDRLGVTVVTNRVDFAAGRLELPNTDSCCACATCGICKSAPIAGARRRGRSTVFVGAALSDRKAALGADVVVAGGELGHWCAEIEWPFIAFATMADVARALTVRSTADVA